MFKSVPLSSVTIRDAFWTPKQHVNREHTIPIEYEQCQNTGRIDAFRLKWEPGHPNPPHIFWDSDVAKWIEAASYSLSTHPDPNLDALLDEVIDLIANAQQPNGYLNVHFTVVEPKKRWMNLRDQHELYCAGHLIEAAVAHYQATGKQKLLDTLCRYADYIAEIFGTQEGQKRGYPGHEEIELALIKLADLTNKKKYLDLARYFVNERGQHSVDYTHYFDAEAACRGEDEANFWAGQDLPQKQRYYYNQAHLPVRQQHEVVGHAVRAMYLYSAMADLARDDLSLLPALKDLWEDVCLRKMYVTGSIGSSQHNEGFTKPYDLPNEGAYAETCAAIGLVFWSQRLLQLNHEEGPDARYADVLERALYNGVISGVSLDGKKFFYENPLAATGDHHRQPWFDCACCPPNLARLLASLGKYIYAISEPHQTQQKLNVSTPKLATHLYIQSSVRVSINEREISIHQETNYPWEGNVRLTFETIQPITFELRLRMPNWCHLAHLRLNQQEITITHQDSYQEVNRKNIQYHLSKGYICIKRTWQTNDVIYFEMDMPIERIYAHPNVRQNAGQVALQRGPLVYCLEQIDNPVPIEHIYLPVEAPLTAKFEDDKLGGVTVISGPALTPSIEDWNKKLYHPKSFNLQPITFTAIPYYAWDNRQPGSMQVWINEK